MPVKTLYTVPLLLAALVLVYQGAMLFKQDLAYTSAQTEISFWGRGNYQPETKTIARTGNTLAGLLKQAPGHPDYLGLQARYSIWQAYRAQNPDNRTQMNQQAITSQYQALESRPAHRHGWSKMVEYASRTTTGQAMLDEAQQRLATLDVAQPHKI